MMIPVLMVSAIVPSLLLIWFFHARDLYPEPQRVIWATFGLGVLTIIPAVIVELLLKLGVDHIDNPFLGGTVEGFVVAGATEESFKYLVVVFYCMRHVEFDEPMDGIVYGAVASLGFATLENLLYVTQGGEGIAVFRALSAVPCHAFLGAIMGYFVGQAKYRPRERRSLLTKALVIPMLLHGAYDAPLLSVARVAKGAHTEGELIVAVLFVLVSLGALGFEGIWTLVLSSRLRREQNDWSARRWAAYYARMPPPPPPWQLPSIWAPAPAAGPSFAPSYSQPYGASPAPWTAAQTMSGSVSHGAPYAAYVAEPSGGGGAAGWLMLAFGSLLATGGGFMLLGVGILMFGPNADAQKVVPIVVAGVLFGLLPLALGVVLFAFGVRRLARATMAPPPAPWGPPRAIGNF